MTRLIVFPLKKEFSAVEEWLAAYSIPTEKKQVEGRWFTEVPRWNAIMVVGGHGKTEYAIKTQFWLQSFKSIGCVIGAGAAGGLSPELKAGDLFAATEIVEHDYVEKFNSKAELPLFQTQSGLFKVDKFSKSPLYLGRLASGDEDIVEEARANELRETTKAHAVAWESAGGIRAAQFNGVDYAEFRCITDNACAKAPTDFLKNLAKGMSNISQLFDTILS